MCSGRLLIQSAATAIPVAPSSAGSPAPWPGAIRFIRTLSDVEHLRSFVT
jgi:hypothetical protein